MNWIKNWAHIDNYLQEDCGKFVDWKDSYTKRIEWSSEAYSQDRYWGWAGEKELKILWHPQSHCKTVPGETSQRLCNSTYAHICTAYFPIV